MYKKPILYCFTKYSTEGASSRYRTFQYLPIIKNHFEVRTQVGFGNWYFDGKIKMPQKILYLLTAFFIRFWRILCLPSNCIVWIEYELFPYLPPIAEWYLKLRNINYSVDYDDAIFHNYDLSPNPILRKLLKNKIPFVIRHAKTVVTGSPYLTDFALRHNPSIVEIPTSIDFSMYQANQEVLEKTNNGAFVIGWLGSTSTSANVIMIKQSLSLLLTMKNAEIWLMGFHTSLKPLLADLPVRFFTWKKENEIPFLNSIDLGIMPLSNKPFNQGKCGFKLIQYMAAGKPTLSTPLAANKKINKNMLNGHAVDDDSWLDSMLYFANNPLISKSIGEDNKKIVKKYYSIEANAESLVQVLKSLTP